MTEDGADRMLQQAFELWFQPEIDRRVSAGTLPSEFSVWAAQVIMEPDGDSPVVRFSDQIRGVLTGRTTRPVAAGEIVRFWGF